MAGPARERGSIIRNRIGVALLATCGAFLLCGVGGAGAGLIATGTTYVVTAGDRGKTLRARVTATNSAGSSTKTSPESPVIAG